MAKIFLLRLKSDMISIKFTVIQKHILILVLTHYLLSPYNYFFPRNIIITNIDRSIDYLIT